MTWSASCYVVLTLTISAVWCCSCKSPYINSHLNHIGVCRAAFGLASSSKNTISSTEQKEEEKLLSPFLIKKGPRVLNQGPLLNKKNSRYIEAFEFEQ